MNFNKLIQFSADKWLWLFNNKTHLTKIFIGIDKRIARMDEVLLAIHEDVKHPSPMENACYSTNGHLLSPSSSAILALSSCGGNSDQNVAHMSEITNGFASPSAPQSAIIRPDSQHSPSRHGSNTPLIIPKINPRTRAVVVVADCATHTVRVRIFIDNVKIRIHFQIV